MKSGVVAQLDDSDKDLITQRKKKCQDNNLLRYASFQDRLQIAKYQAKLAFPSKQGDPLCENCESPFHSQDDCCDILDTLDSVRELEQLLESAEVEVHHPRTSTEEDPQVGIHRGIIHRLLYLTTCSLYRLHHPHFYPDGPQECVEPDQVFPVPLTGPDYLRLAPSRKRLWIIKLFQASVLRRLDKPISTLAQWSATYYYSKAFPLTFSDFCDRLADYVAAAEAEDDPDHSSDHTL
jgi:hypothetical protein